MTPKIADLIPFGYAYRNCKSDDITMKIAAGWHAFMERIPVTIQTDSRLAFLDMNGPYWEQGICFAYHSGVYVNHDKMEEYMEAYPELAEELRDYIEYFEQRDYHELCNHTLVPLDIQLLSSKTLWGGHDWGGHSNPDYQMLLDLGTDGLREKIAHYRGEHPDKSEFYDALMLTLDTVDMLSERYRLYAIEMMEKDAENRAIYERIAKALEIVPKKPAVDFMTACQSFAMVFFMDGNDSPGNFDQYCGKFFEMGDREENMEILEGLWREFKRVRTWNLCISGSDENWNDRTNELSWAILSLVEKYKFDTPNLTMRIHRNTPEDFLKYAVKVMSAGTGMPVLYNDEIVCPALEDLGIPPCDSHMYAMNGCNQIDIQGKSHMGLEDGEIYVLKCLERALHNGKCLIKDETFGLQTGDARDFKSFDELMTAFYAQLDWVVAYATDMANKYQKFFAEYGPSPIRSVLIQGCIEKGKNYKDGGPIYNHGQILSEGLTDAIDSLANIKHFVFDTHKYTMAQVVDALECDYEGYEEMYRDFKRSKLKFGNDIDEVDALGGEIQRHFYSELMKYHTYRDPVNGIYGGGLSTFNRTAAFGVWAGASANGRHKGDIMISDSLGAVPGCDMNGPTALIRSALAYDHRLAKSGFVFQMKFEKELFASPKGQESALALIKAYFAGGGQQMSINVLDSAELLDAMEHPENHQNLVVRVGGYSDIFVNLPIGLRQNIISRTMHSL